MVVACTLAFASSFASAQAAPAGMWQLNVGGFSYHMPHNKEHNEVNYALGAEYQWTESIALQAGVYKNSGNRNSVYLFTQYHPFEVYGVRLGLTAGLVNGYPTLNDGKFGRIALPSFSKQFKHFGIDGIFMPQIGSKEGVAFVGFKFPFDEMKGWVK